MLTEEPVVWCWGCAKLILVPFAGAAPAELFKCGWCGAVNDLKQQPLVASSSAAAADYYTHQQQQWQQHHHQHQQHRQQQQQQPQSTARCRAAAAAAVSALRWLPVVLVLVLIGTVAAGGVVSLLPLVCSTWATFLPNLSLALAILFQTVFNYAAAVLTPAGRVSDFVSPPARTPGGCVPAGSLQHWSWCRHCAAAKPPQAHHCKACARCIYQMDHHCVLLNGCVGQGNLRAFMLFLLWTLLASSYCVLMCSLLTWLHWGDVKAAVAAGRASRAAAAGSRQHSSSMQVLVLNPGAAGGGSNSSATTGWVPQHQQLPHHQPPPAAAVPEVWLLATTGIFFLVLQASPWWLLVAWYVVAVSIGLLVAVGMLFGSQLYYLGLGVSYIDHLKAAAGGSGQEGGSGQQQEQQALQEQLRWARAVARFEVTWVRWWEVVGACPPANPSVGSMLAAVLTPRWRRSHGSPGGSKKWT